jgi:hypothetical protein
LFILLVAGALVIWLAFLLSAVLTSVSSDLNVFAASDADAATTLNCGTPSCGTGTILDYSFTAPANSWAVVAARSTVANGDPDLCVYSDAGYSSLKACSDVSSVNGVVEFRRHGLPSRGGRDELPAHPAHGFGRGLHPARLRDGARVRTGADHPHLVRRQRGQGLQRARDRGDEIPGGPRRDFGDLGLRPRRVPLEPGGRLRRRTRLGGGARRQARRGPGRGHLLRGPPRTTPSAVVLWVNNAATSANYRIEVRTATQLFANVPETFGGTNQRDFFYVPGNPRGWSVLALRPQPTSDADLRLFDSPDYLTLLRSSNAVVGVVDLVIANYANAPEIPGPCLMVSPGPLGSYLLDWHEHPAGSVVGGRRPARSRGRIGTGFTAQLVAGTQ